MSGTVADRFASDQAALALALTGGRPRNADEALYARMLEAKRRAEVAHALPLLAAALGPQLPGEFARWWRTTAHDQPDFRAGVLAAGRAMQAAVPRAALAAVRGELAEWSAGGRGPLLGAARSPGRTILWLRLTPGGRLWRFVLP